MGERTPAARLDMIGPAEDAEERPGYRADEQPRKSRTERRGAARPRAILTPIRFSAEA